MQTNDAEARAADGLCRNFRSSDLYARRFWFRPLFELVRRVGFRLRSTTLIVYFNHYLTVNSPATASAEALVRLHASVPAADRLIEDDGMTDPVAPMTPEEFEGLADDSGALEPFLHFLGLVSAFAKTDAVFESALGDLRDPMTAGYVAWAEYVSRTTEARY